MTRIRLQNVPRLRLLDLLKRRKTSLAIFMREHGIVTYERLKEESHRIGVAEPTQEEFNLAVYEAKLVGVSSPQEGMIVLEPPRIIDERTGKPLDPDAPIDQPGVTVVTGEPEPSPEPTGSPRLFQPKKTKVSKPQGE